MASIQTDWQLESSELNQRGAYFLRTSQWSDCSFLVGTELNQVVVFGHKVVLAMASSVFDAMLKRTTKIKEPIPILDIQIDTFRALLQYIYTGKLFISSFNEVLHLYCAAQKYMLLTLVEACTEYLLFNMNPSNVCRTYKFARLYKQDDLIKGCIEVISLQIKEVLNDSSFEELDLETVISVFSLDFLNVESELDLFKAAVRYAKATEKRNIKDTSLPTEEPFVIETLQKSSVPSQETEQNVECSNLKVVNIDSSAESNAEAVIQTYRPDESQTTALITPIKTDKPADNKEEPCIRTLVEKIRFLTLSPEEFGAGPANSLLLSESEAFAVLMNIVNPQTDLPLPPGFSTSRISRIETIEKNSHITSTSTSVPSTRVSVERVDPRPSTLDGAKTKEAINRCRRSGKIYCRRALLRPSGGLYTGVRDCSVTFTVDKKICLLGIQLARPGKKTDSDSIEVDCCAELLDANGVRLVQAAFSQSDNGAPLKEVLFERRVYIRGNKVYRVSVEFEEVLWYPMESCARQVKVNGVLFDFAIGESCNSVRDGIVRSILFTH